MRCYRLQYSGFGTISEIDTLADSGSAWTYEKVFGYDGAQRVTAETIAGRGTSTFSYDAVGNFGTKAGQNYYYYGGTNRLKGIGADTSVVQFRYDVMGRLVKDSVRNHTFRRNWAGQADSIHLGVDANNKPWWLRNWFDAKGKRVRAEQHYYRKYLCDPGEPDGPAGGGEGMDGPGPGGGTYCYEKTARTLYYLWWNDKTPIILDAAGKPTDEVGFYVGGERLWALKGTGGMQKYNILSDHLGSARRLVQRGGTEYVTNAIDYDVWGAQLAVTGAGTKVFQYTDQAWEDFGSLDLYYYGARWYDPERARFESPDPVLNPNQSPYSYVGNNPVHLTDPKGLEGTFYTSHGFIIQGGESIHKSDPFRRVDFLLEPRDKDPYRARAMQRTNEAIAKKEERGDPDAKRLRDLFDHGRIDMGVEDWRYQDYDVIGQTHDGYSIQLNSKGVLSASLAGIGSTLSHELVHLDYDEGPQNQHEEELASRAKYRSYWMYDDDDRLALPYSKYEGPGGYASESEWMQHQADIHHWDELVTDDDTPIPGWDQSSNVFEYFSPTPHLEPPGLP